MDDLTIVLCICIGTVVAWLLALYSEKGLILLIWNVSFGMIGTALCAAILVWSGTEYGGVWLLTAGPPSALLAIVTGQAARCALARRLI